MVFENDGVCMQVLSVNFHDMQNKVRGFDEVTLATSSLTNPCTERSTIESARESRREEYRNRLSAVFLGVGGYCATVAGDVEKLKGITSQFKPSVETLKTEQGTLEFRNASLKGQEKVHEGELVVNEMVNSYCSNLKNALRSGNDASATEIITDLKSSLGQSGMAEKYAEYVKLQQQIVDANKRHDLKSASEKLEKLSSLYNDEGFAKYLTARKILASVDIKDDVSSILAKSDTVISALDKVSFDATQDSDKIRTDLLRIALKSETIKELMLDSNKKYEV